MTTIQNQLKSLTVQLNNLNKELVAVEKQKPNKNTPSQILKYQTEINKVLLQISNLTTPPIIVPVTGVTIPPTNPVPVYGQVIPFDAELNTRDDLSAYNHIAGDNLSANVINPQLISVIDDPAYGSQRKVMNLIVKPTDTGGVTENARAQCQTPMQYVEGQEIFYSVSINFNNFFWTYFLTFSEIYGAPYNGTSPLRLGVQESNIIVSNRNNAGTEIHFWTQPMVLNQWYDFIVREVLSQDSTKGEVQVWLRKQGETDFTEIVPTTYFASVTSANITGPNYHKVACYYDATHTYTNSKDKILVDDLNLYITNHKIGNSFNEVAPALLNI